MNIYFYFKSFFSPNIILWIRRNQLRQTCSKNVAQSQKNFGSNSKRFYKIIIFYNFFLIERSSGRVERSSDNPAKNFLFKERTMFGELPKDYKNYSDNFYFQNVPLNRYNAVLKIKSKFVLSKFKIFACGQISFRWFSLLWKLNKVKLIRTKLSHCRSFISASRDPKCLRSKHSPRTDFVLSDRNSNVVR